MTEERSIDRLARYIMLAAATGIIAALCWYFSSVLIYILIAVVVSLIAKPIVNQLKKSGYAATVHLTGCWQSPPWHWC